MIINPTTINVTGQPPLAGNVVVAAGTNITLTQAGNQISIAAAGGAGGNFPTVKNGTDVGETATIAAGFQMIAKQIFINSGKIVNAGTMVIL